MHKFVFWLGANNNSIRFGVLVLISWAIFGTIIGLAQWFVLRDRIHHTHWWVWALSTSAGTLIGLALIKIFSISGLWSLVLSGSTIGFAQYLILRKRFFYSGWRIIIYIVADAASQIIISLINQSILGVPDLFFQLINVCLIVLIIELVKSSLTGITMAWILQYPISITTDTDLLN